MNTSAYPLPISSNGESSQAYSGSWASAQTTDHNSDPLFELREENRQRFQKYREATPINQLFEKNECNTLKAFELFCTGQLTSNLEIQNSIKNTLTNIQVLYISPTNKKREKFFLDLIQHTSLHEIVLAETGICKQLGICQDQWMRLLDKLNKAKKFGQLSYKKKLLDKLIKAYPSKETTPSIISVILQSCHKLPCQNMIDSLYIAQAALAVLQDENQSQNVLNNWRINWRNTIRTKVQQLKTAQAHSPTVDTWQSQASSAKKELKEQSKQSAFVSPRNPSPSFFSTQLETKHDEMVARKIEHLLSKDKVGNFLRSNNMTNVSTWEHRMQTLGITGSIEDSVSRVKLIDKLGADFEKLQNKISLKEIICPVLETDLQMKICLEYFKAIRNFICQKSISKHKPIKSLWDAVDCRTAWEIIDLCNDISPTSHNTFLEDSIRKLESALLVFQSAKQCRFILNSSSFAKAISEMYQTNKRLLPISEDKKPSTPFNLFLYRKKK